MHVCGATLRHTGGALEKQGADLNRIVSSSAVFCLNAKISGTLVY